MDIEALANIASAIIAVISISTGALAGLRSRRRPQATHPPHPGAAEPPAPAPAPAPGPPAGWALRPVWILEPVAEANPLDDTSEGAETPDHQ
ncbi:hypothetical protein GCM10023178_06690 [Actinomadura luteofluorescens]